MATVVDPSGQHAAVQSLLAATAIIPVSFIPVLWSPAASLYMALTLVLGAAQLACAVMFLVQRNEPAARNLLRASLIYLPCLLTTLCFVP